MGRWTSASIGNPTIFSWSGLAATGVLRTGCLLADHHSCRSCREIARKGFQVLGKLGKLASHFWSAQSGPYALLILLFLTVFAIPPLLSARVVMPVILQIAFWLIIVAGAFNVSPRPSIRLFAVTTALLSIALPWLGRKFSGRTITEVDLFLSIVMLSIFTLLMIQRFLVMGRPWAHRIAAAVAVYMLFGLIWARLYEGIELLAPVPSALLIARS